MMSSQQPCPGCWYNPTCSFAFERQMIHHQGHVQARVLWRAVILPKPAYHTVLLAGMNTMLE